MFQSAFPDLRYTIENIIADGDMVAERMRFEGTHRGDFQGLPPTGMRVSFTGMQISRMSGGKIVELWGEFDALGMMQQLGAIPSPGQPLAAPATGHAAQNTRVSDGVGSDLR
jgi:predicted ester cyclase